MRAERDDARFIARKESNVVKWGVAVLFGCTVTGSMIMLAASNMGKNNPAAVATKLESNTARSNTAGTSRTYSEAEKEYLRNWWKADEEHWQRSTEAAKAARQPQAEIVWTKDMINEFAKREAEANKAQQASYNTDSKKPQNAIDILNARKWGEVEPYEETRKRQKQQEIVIVGQERKPGDWVCSFVGGEGSLERRNCKSSLQFHERNGSYSGNRKP